MFYSERLSENHVFRGAHPTLPFHSDFRFPHQILLRARMFLAGFLAVWIGIPAEIYGQQAPPPAAQQPAATET